MAHDAYANNIANANTPNFSASDVSFKEALARAGGEKPDGDALDLAVTNDAHFGLQTGEQPFEPAVTVNTATKYRSDGNNVDVDQQMAELSVNADYGQTSTQLLRSDYTGLRQVITG